MRGARLCGGSALRVKALTRGRLPKLSSLKGLDDRVDWWHDVALATYFFMNGYAISPWGDLRENGHPGPAHGPTAFERVANGDGLAPGALPLEGAAAPPPTPPNATECVVCRKRASMSRTSS